LGLWYHGAGQVFSERKSFQELDQPHCDFHEVGKTLVEMVTAGASLADLTPHLRELSEHSVVVLSKLQELENEGLMDMHSAHEEWIAHSLHPKRSI
jgi:hypothetical protein